jgi:hypothetical protein
MFLDTVGLIHVYTLRIIFISGLSLLVIIVAQKWLKSVNMGDLWKQFISQRFAEIYACFIL